MSVGAYTTTLYAETGASSAANLNQTKVSRGYFSAGVRLTSVFVLSYTSSNTNKNLKVVIYDAGGTKLFTGPTQVVTGGSGTHVEVSLGGTGYILQGNTNYNIGVCTEGTIFWMGGRAAGDLLQNTSYASSPAHTTFTKLAAGNYSANGDTFPTTASNETISGFSYNSIDPTVSALTPSGSIDNKTATRFSWTFTDNGRGAQTGFTFGYREIAGRNPNWIEVVQTTANAYYDMPADTLKEGVLYEWYVKATDAIGYSAPITSTVTNNSWTTQTEVVSSTASGVINATAFTVGAYDVEVRVHDGKSYGEWSTLSTFTLGPPSNTYVKVASTMKQCIQYVKVAGVWKQVPPTKYKSGGVFN